MLKTVIVWAVFAMVCVAFVPNCTGIGQAAANLILKSSSYVDDIDGG